MKGQFIVYEKFSEENMTGIQRKMMNQVRIFNQNGLQCEKKYLPRGDEKCGVLAGAFLSLFPRVNKYPVWQEEDEFAALDFIYFRRPIAMSYAMRKFLRKIKNINPNIKIVMEIPTYPYDGELQSLSLFPFLCKDWYNRRKMQGLIDRLVVISGGSIENKIWGIPVIPMQNGYDVQNVEIAEEPCDKSCINICCVAMFQPWHGYERLLLGMQKYYENGGKREIKCHMVGEGQERLRYEKIAENIHLKNRVIFYGKQSGEQLSVLYNGMDIGVCSLGSYKRKDLGEVSSELKSREYMAKGIPLIVGSKIDVFQNKAVDFVCEFENDDSILDLERIIKFSDSLQLQKGLRKRIREFALEKVDMSITMKPVIDYIKKG